MFLETGALQIQQIVPLKQFFDPELWNIQQPSSMSCYSLGTCSIFYMFQFHSSKVRDIFGKTAFDYSMYAAKLSAEASMPANIQKNMELYSGSHVADRIWFSDSINIILFFIQYVCHMHVMCSLCCFHKRNTLQLTYPARMDHIPISRFGRLWQRIHRNRRVSTLEIPMDYYVCK